MGMQLQQKYHFTLTLHCCAAFTFGTRDSCQPREAVLGRSLLNHVPVAAAGAATESAGI